MFSVSQCFKYGFDFVYFSKFSVREGKHICYRLTDQRKQRKSLGIIGNPCFDSRHFQCVSGMLWSPASLKLLLFDDNTSLLWGYTTNNYGTFWSLRCVLLLLKDSVLLPFCPCNTFSFFLQSNVQIHSFLENYLPMPWLILWSFSTVVIHGLASFSFQSVLTAFALRSLNNKINKHIRLQEQNHQYLTRHLTRYYKVQHTLYASQAEFRCSHSLICFNFRGFLDSNTDFP